MKHDFRNSYDFYLVCDHCLQHDNSLTKTDCPGYIGSDIDDRANQIKQGWDFKNGCWIVPKDKGWRTMTEWGDCKCLNRNNSIAGLKFEKDCSKCAKCGEVVTRFTNLTREEG